MSSQNNVTALPLELHTHILSNLQPYDILQVRQTCQALHLASSQRTVWVNALHQICVENTLFEPSFPVASMSVLELQRASMGPHRWIARTSSKERNSDGVLPRSATQRLIPRMDNGPDTGPEILRALYLVPGGRYLFWISCDWLILWDLGSPYSSDSEPHIVAAVSVKVYGLFCLVHSTPDRMGLRVSLHVERSDSIPSLSIYEVYPESISPQLTLIAHVPSLHARSYSLSYNRLIFTLGNTLTVWDYKANTWARWDFESDYDYNRILTTKSTVMLIRPYGVSVWEIPPLLPKSSMSKGSSVMSPLFELHYPENQRYCRFHQVPCDWYSGTSHPLYYAVEEDGGEHTIKINRFEVVVNDSEIFGSTLNLLTTFEVPSYMSYYSFIDAARICQGKNVSLCSSANTRFLETHVTDIYNQQLPSFFAPLYRQDHSSDIATFCPATGRLVYRTVTSPIIFVLDL